MIPSFVTSLPTGNETGTFLVAHLGGTNLRVNAVQLLGNGEVNIVENKRLATNDLKSGSGETFFLMDSINHQELVTEKAPRIVQAGASERPRDSLTWCMLEFPHLSKSIRLIPNLTVISRIPLCSPFKHQNVPLIPSPFTSLVKLLWTQVPCCVWAKASSCPTIQGRVFQYTLSIKLSSER